MSKGFPHAAYESALNGATAMMFLTGSPQSKARRPISEFNISEGVKEARRLGIFDFVVHAPYIINLASPEQDKWEFGIEMLINEINRTAAFHAKNIVVHPGAYTTSSVNQGIYRIAAAIKKALAATANINICLETMAGKGTEMGTTFYQLHSIIDLVKDERLNVCLDTCHIWDAGYDIKNNTEAVLDHFNQVIGFDRLKVIHLNDSLNSCGSHKDRHANIGRGEIGFRPLNFIAHYPAFENIPKLLETPSGIYRQEINAIKFNEVII
jgi:deoxyribonuclease-4